MINDYAFVLPSQAKGLSSTNTLRIWKTPYRAGSATIYLAVTRQYVGTLWRLFHSVGTDIDASKALFLKTLEQAHQGNILCQQKLVEPMTGTFLLGGDYFTRGEVTIVGFHVDVQAEMALLCSGVVSGVIQKG